MNNSRGLFSIILGLLLIAAAGVLATYNVFADHKAMESSTDALAELELIIPANPAVVQPLIYTQTEQAETTESPVIPEAADTVIPDYILNPDMEMPTEKINGQHYIGILEIPAIGLYLPIISQWSDYSLNIAPCRYTGSAYKGDLIIAGHNYNSHFASLNRLSQGDTVYFTDVDGNIFRYEVAERETLQPTAVEQMQSGDWDLTLFTCTYGGQARITIRCFATE